jgi:hypothetical protein
VQLGSLRDLVRHPADPFVEKFIRAQRPPLELGGFAAQGGERPPGTP